MPLSTLHMWEEKLGSVPVFTFKRETERGGSGALGWPSTSYSAIVIGWPRAVACLAAAMMCRSTHTLGRAGNLIWNLTELVAVQYYPGAVG